MSVLFIYSDKPLAGKTCLAMALLSLLENQGRKGVYYKPFSDTPSADPDVAAVSAAFSHSPKPPQQLIAGAADGESARQIIANIQDLQKSHEVVLVEGPDLEHNLAVVSALDTNVAAGLSSKVIMVFTGSPALQAEDIMPVCNLFGDRMAGVLINQATRYRREGIKAQLLPALASRNLPVLGVLPEDRSLLSVTVSDVAQFLGGRWVQEPPEIDSLLAHFLIGGNIMDEGPNYYCRHSAQAVITRGGRPDIQMASFSGDTRCLILTEGVEPTEYIRVEAMKHGVPLLLVEDDTKATAEALGGLLEHRAPPSRAKADRFAQLVTEDLDQAVLAAALE